MHQIASNSYKISQMSLLSPKIWMHMKQTRDDKPNPNQDYKHQLKLTNVNDTKNTTNK